MAKVSPTAYKKGQLRPLNSGRKPGTPNRITSDLKKALEDSAAIVGMPKWAPKLTRTGRGIGFFRWLLSITQRDDHRRIAAAVRRPLPGSG